MKLFRHNHPQYRLDDVQDFNLQILEFLLLFGATSGTEHSLSTQTVKSLDERCDQHLRLRRTWLRRRHASRTEEYAMGELLAWGQWLPSVSPRSQDYLVGGSPTPPSICRLLPVFLALSATAADLRGESPNEYWMDLAAEFMLQSAVERLCYLGRRPGDGVRHEVFDDNEEMIRQCFAYGVVPSYRHQRDGKTTYPDLPGSVNPTDLAREKILNRTLDQDDLERRLVRIFCTEQEGDDSPGSHNDDDDDNSNNNEKLIEEDEIPMAGDQSSPPEPRESPTWTQTRLRYLSLFIVRSSAPHFLVPRRHHSDEEDGIRHPDPDIALADIVSAYPLTRFRQKVLRFIESLWRDLGSGNDRTRPLLVSVECGDYEGLGLEGKGNLQGMLRRARVC